jgi:Domain of unknown function (DUF4338)
MTIELERTASTMKTWGTWLDIRSRHYVPYKGLGGRQLHYLVRYQGQVIGICSGASCVMAVKPRDEFFGITDENRDTAERQRAKSIADDHCEMAETGR